MKTLYPVAYLNLVFILSCNQPSQYSIDSKATISQKEENGIVCTPENSILQMQMSDQTTGMKGVGKNGGMKITGPQNELNVIIDGFKIIPLLSLGSWAPFALCADSAMIIGDIIITETNFPAVQQEVIAQGLTVTDIHKYPARNGSVILFMHIIGSGNNTRLSTSAQALLQKLEQVGGKHPKEEKANSVISNLNTALLDSIIGYKGKVAGEVYKHTIGRPDVLKAHGIPVSEFLEFKTWAAWQGTDEKAVVAGDFTMLKNEVGPVIKALAENGFEGVVVHNDLIHEEPGVFFLHYWAVGNAEKLANGLKTALNQQARK